MIVPESIECVYKIILSLILDLLYKGTVFVLCTPEMNKWEDNGNPKTIDF